MLKYATNLSLKIRELEINILRKFDVGFFNSDKEKNADDAEHQRVFLTQYEWKKTS